MTYQSSTPQEKLLNSELEKIVLSRGGTITSHDKIALLQAWLKSLTD